MKMKLPQIIFNIKTKGICSEVTQAAASVILKIENGYSARVCVYVEVENRTQLAIVLR